MTRHEKFQDSNALIEISRQLKVAASLPTAPTASVAGVSTVPGGSPRHQSTQVVKKFKRLAFQQSKTANHLSASKRSATVSASSSPGKKAKKVSQTDDTQDPIGSLNTDPQPLKPRKAGGGAQPVTSATHEPAAMQHSLLAPSKQDFSAWFASSYTQAFAEELTAMREGHDMSQSQLKLLLRTLQLGSSSYDVSDRGILSQVKQSTDQSVSGAHVAVWM